LKPWKNLRTRIAAYMAPTAEEQSEHLEQLYRDSPDETGAAPTCQAAQVLPHRYACFGAENAVLVLYIERTGGAERPTDLNACVIHAAQYIDAHADDQVSVTDFLRSRAAGIVTDLVNELRAHDIDAFDMIELAGQSMAIHYYSP
jgi:hypothetical protein